MRKFVYMYNIVHVEDRITYYTYSYVYDIDIMYIVQVYVFILFESFTSSIIS